MTHRSLCLSNLTLMVREHQVHTTTMDVEHLAQVLTTHRRTFAVPSGETVAPRTWPAHDMFGLSLLPQGKVGLILLLAHTSQFTTLVLDVLQRTAREDTILELFVVSLDIEINRTIALVGKSVVQNLLHQLLLLDDMTCSMWLNRGAQHVQRIHILMVAVGVVLGNLHGFQLLQTGFLGNLVLALVGIMLQMAYIRNVAYIAHFIAQMLQITKQQIKGDGRAGMS